MYNSLYGEVFCKKIFTSRLCFAFVICNFSVRWHVFLLSFKLLDKRLVRTWPYDTWPYCYNIQYTIKPGVCGHFTITHVLLEYIVPSLVNFAVIITFVLWRLSIRFWSMAMGQLAHSPTKAIVRLDTAGEEAWGTVGVPTVQHKGD